MELFKSALPASFERHQILRWGAYGAVIGTLSALMACLVFYALEWGTFFALEYLAGYKLGKPAGEHLVPLVSSTPLRLWLLCLMPAIGGLVSGLLVYTWAPEAEGHGTDAFIDAFHNKKGIVRTRVPFIKGLASVITLATGGSAGREGPIAQIGAGIGSWLGQALKLSVHDRRLLLLAGCAGGLGAIFRAPLGGALTAIEVLYREDFETEGIILCIISSVVANSIFTTVFGHSAIFAIPPIRFENPSELLACAALGLLCAPFGFFYVKVFYGLRDHFFSKFPIRKAFRPAIGGLMVGVVALWNPLILGSGYGTMQETLMGRVPLALLLTLAVLKIFTTSFTISSGGSGGVFGPSLFIGTMLGGAVGQFAHEFFPSIVQHPGALALVGMGAFFAGVAKAPVGALLMVCEMTGGYNLVVPLMFTAVLAILLSQHWNLYEKQVLNKFRSPAHKGDRVFNILQALKVSDVYSRDSAVSLLPEDMSFAQLKKLMTWNRDSIFPVVDENCRLTGILSCGALREVLFDPGVEKLLVVGELALPPVSVAPEDTLSDALARLMQSGYSEIPVEDGGRQVLGMLRLEDVMQAYHRGVKKFQEDQG